MHVRDALESDLESIAELLLVVHQMHVKAQPDTYRDISHAEVLGFLSTRLGVPNAYLRVAEVESVVEGYCFAEIQENSSTPILLPSEFIYINELVVRPGSRRSGIGRALVLYLKKFAQQKGITQIKLDVGQFNSEARAFFKSQGFELLREKLSTRVDT
jgi:ribosomal protein S18 acetylase RimI-like enzyme